MHSAAFPAKAGMGGKVGTPVTAGRGKKAEKRKRRKLDEVEEEPPSTADLGPLVEQHKYLLKLTREQQAEETRVCVSVKDKVDGWKWEGYGSRGRNQKDTDTEVTGRCYYRCSAVHRKVSCKARKVVEAHPTDSRLAQIIYKNKHNHEMPKQEQNVPAIFQVVFQPTFRFDFEERPSTNPPATGSGSVSIAMQAKASIRALSLDSALLFQNAKRPVPLMIGNFTNGSLQPKPQPIHIPPYGKGSASASNMQQPALKSSSVSPLTSVDWNLAGITGSAEPPKAGYPSNKLSSFGSTGDAAASLSSVNAVLDMLNPSLNQSLSALQPHQASNFQGLDQNQYQQQQQQQQQQKQRLRDQLNPQKQYEVHQHRNQYAQKSKSLGHVPIQQTTFFAPAALDLAQVSTHDTPSKISLSPQVALMKDLILLQFPDNIDGGKSDLGKPALSTFAQPQRQWKSLPVECGIGHLSWPDPSGVNRDHMQQVVQHDNVLMARLGDTPAGGPDVDSASAAHKSRLAIAHLLAPKK